MPNKKGKREQGNRGKQKNAEGKTLKISISDDEDTQDKSNRTNMNEIMGNELMSFPGDVKVSCFGQ